VSLDDLVDLLHQADGLSQSDDDLLVVGEVVLGERATLAVFEPLLADLVAADVEVRAAPLLVLPISSRISSAVTWAQVRRSTSEVIRQPVM
jgi:hypothetical protein